MAASPRALITVAALLMALPANAQPAADPRVADIVGMGKIRVGLHLPQFVQDPKTGELHGHGTGTVIVQIAQALADRLKVRLELVGNPSPPALIKCLRAGACDVGFLGLAKGRSPEVDYAPPHIMVPFTYLVPPNSTIRTIADADKAGTRIAAVRDHISTLTLRQVIRHAAIVQVDIPDEAFELVRSARADAYASPRPPILEYAKRLPGARVLDGHYGANIQAIALSKGQAARLAYVSEFIEDAKATGLVQRMIERAGERGIAVAPVESPVQTGTVPGKDKP